METMETKLDKALSLLRLYRNAILGKLISVAPGEDLPKFLVPNLDPMSAYSLIRQLESAIDGSSAVEDVWKHLESNVKESEKLSDMEKTAFLKTVFLQAGLHYNRACQPEATLEYAEKLSDLNITQAYFLKAFAYRVQGKYKAAIDQALRALDMVFDPPPNLGGFGLAIHAASEIGHLVRTVTEHGTQPDLLQSFDPSSRLATVIQAAEWATEAFVCHRIFFPDAIQIARDFATDVLQATVRLSEFVFYCNLHWRSTDRPMERLSAVCNQLLLYHLPDYLPP